MILLSDNNGASIVIKVVLLAIAIIGAIIRASNKNDKKASTYSPLTETELSETQKMYSIYKSCVFKKMDLKTGIMCGLNDVKPNFKDSCPDFVEN